MARSDGRTSTYDKGSRSIPERAVRGRRISEMSEDDADACLVDGLDKGLADLFR
jgi:hypothetical protein